VYVSSAKRRRRQDCCNEVSNYWKLVAAVATYLSDTRVTDEEKLEKIVVFAGMHGELEYKINGGN
jgi:hypothetical protein